MQFKTTVILTALVAAVSAQNATNGTGNGTSTAGPTSAEPNGAMNHLVNAGALGAIVAGGMALAL